jgi:hypothetical protein
LVFHFAHKNISFSFDTSKEMWRSYCYRNHQRNWIQQGSLRKVQVQVSVCLATGP